MSDDGQIEETSDQKKLASIATSKWADYETRLRPFEDKLIAQVKQMGQLGGKAAGAASSGVSQTFGAAGKKVEAALAPGGASGRLKLGLSDYSLDQGRSAGFGRAGAKQATETRHLKNLESLVALGQGKQAKALAGLSDVAALSGRQAIVDAGNAARERAGYAAAGGAIAGSVAGSFDLSGGAQSPPSVTGKAAPSWTDASLAEAGVNGGDFITIDQAQQDWSLGTGV